MPPPPIDLTPSDRLYLRRTYELASRGIGSTAPNPPVGAVVVREGTIVGEGYHHRAGEPHAEINALAVAGAAARGATLYVSLEPCNHTGRTPPCTNAIVQAGIARVVAGTLDPNPTTDGSGVASLRARGVSVDVAGDERARELLAVFEHSMRAGRPYTVLKMAMSLDGAIASQPGVRERLTSDDARLYVRELRVAYDAVMVGAGTVRVDDPLLTVRPPRSRLRPFVRIVACETETVAETSRIFEAVEGYATTIVLAPAGIRERFDNLRGRAELLFVGETGDVRLDLARAMERLRERGIASVLCEGGPTLAGRLVAAGLVDRFYWLVAPALLCSERPVPVLAGADLAALQLRLSFDAVERVGADAVISGRIEPKAGGADV